MATIYYCIPCAKKFSCKKTISEKDKEKREKEYEETGEIPQCFLCEKNH
jgi:hypothetical protein